MPEYPCSKCGVVFHARVALRDHDCKLPAVDSSMADDTLRAISSYLGMGGCWDTEPLDYDEMQKRIVEGIDSIIRIQTDKIALDARRYRRLQVLGCAPSTSPALDNGTVLCFTNLDKFVDDDISAQPSRGDVPIFG